MTTFPAFLPARLMLQDSELLALTHHTNATGLACCTLHFSAAQLHRPATNGEAFEQIGYVKGLALHLLGLQTSSHTRQHQSMGRLRRARLRHAGSPNPWQWQHSLALPLTAQWSAYTQLGEQAPITLELELAHGAELALHAHHLSITWPTDAHWQELMAC